MAPSTVEPIPLEGRSLVSVCVTISMLVLSTVVVCTRLKLRAWKARSSKMWDWDDMLALAGLVSTEVLVDGFVQTRADELLTGAPGSRSPSPLFVLL